MIRDFKPFHQLAPSNPFQMQWRPWLGGSIIAGLVLLLVPQGSPWSGQTFFSPVVMGRNIGTLGLPLFGLVAAGAYRGLLRRKFADSSAA
jgi:xanthine/uracil permease